MIPPTLPHITSSNWRQMHDQGWRYHSKLPLRERKREKKIKELQEEYGIAKVTIGMPWDKAQLGPVHHDHDQAVYVKDVDTLVEDLYREMEEFERAS